LLNLNAADLGIALICLRVLNDLVVTDTHARCVGHPDDHAAGLRFMKDVRRHDLEHDGITHLVCKRCCSGGAFAEPLLRNGDPVRVGDELGFGRGKCLTLFAFYAREDVFYRGLVFYSPFE